ncbi:MAG: helix-turn-helix domain-containing protein [Clostridiales bacterium]|nr:helix-turn-helix domain-containing protein [Clostridiales bacterium]
MNGIGTVIKNLRKEEGVSQTKLIKGLCSHTTLCRIESEERRPDQLLLEAILQRLGKSFDKFGTIISVKDYHMLEERDNIWNALLRGKYEEAYHRLRSYEKDVNMQDTFQKQFVLKCLGMLQAEKGKWKESVETIAQAIYLTVRDFMEMSIEKLVLGRSEMFLILLLSRGYEKLGRQEEAKKLVYGLLKNIEKKKWDEEELVKIYPKVVYAGIQFLKEEKKYEVVILLANKAIDLLKRNEVIFQLADFMEELMWAMQQKAREENRKLIQEEAFLYIQIKRQKAALEKVWEEYGGIPQENMWCCTNIQKNLVTSNEIIRKCRENAGLSQEALSDEVCSSETLSRIERGLVTPEEKNYRSLMEKMNQAMERDRGFINVEEYELREELRMVSKYTTQMEYEKAYRVWHKLRKKIPKNSMENRQCILRYDTLIHYGKREIGWEEAIRRYETALRETMPKFGKIDITRWPLTRTEIFLLNNIASGYYNIGRKQEAKEILNSIKKSIQSSNVAVTYQVREYVVVLYNIAMIEKLEGNTARAQRIFEEGIYLELQAGRFTKVAKLLYGIGWVLKEEGQEEKARQVIKQAFFLSDITNSPRLHNDIYNYWQRNWNDSILPKSYHNPIQDLCTEES